MNEKTLQDLSDAFTNIISMVLVSLRARGWRGLLGLPMALLTEYRMRRTGREMAAMFQGLIADLRAGRLAPMPEPEPADATPPRHMNVADHAQSWGRHPRAQPDLRPLPAHRSPRRLSVPELPAGAVAGA